jgi:BON domain
MNTPHGFRPDQELMTAVLQALRRNRFIPPNTMQIGLTQGWVTLMGEVDCASQRQLAEATVRAVDGVMGVTNRVTIKLRVPQVYVASGLPSGDAAPASHLPSDASSTCKSCGAARLRMLEARSEPQSQTGSDQDLQLEE